MVLLIPALTEQERNALTTYDRGFVDGMWQYAWWKDGVAYVGSTGTTYAQAVDRFLRERGYRADSNPRKRPDTGAMLSTMRLARDQLDAWCEGFPHEVDDQDRAVLAELDSFVDSRTSELLEISGESTATDVLTGALREIAEADAKTPVLTLNRIAERALEAWSNEKKIA